MSSQIEVSENDFELKYKPKTKNVIWQEHLIGHFEQSSVCKGQSTVLQALHHKLEVIARLQVS